MLAFISKYLLLLLLHLILQLLVLLDGHARGDMRIQAPARKNSLRGTLPTRTCFLPAKSRESRALHARKHF